MTSDDHIDFTQTAPPPVIVSGRAARLWTTMDSWLVKQLIGLIAISLLLFTIIWLAPETLFRLTHIFFDGRISSGQFGELLLYHLPNILQQSIPLAALFGSIFLFRRLSHNLELVTLLNGGVSPKRIMVPIALVGIFIMLGHVVLQEVVTPLSGPRYDVLREKAGISTTRPASFTFVDKTPQGVWKTFFLIENSQPVGDNRPVEDVYILQYGQLPATGSGVNSQGGLYLKRILKAETATWQPESSTWALKQPIAYRLDEAGLYMGSEQLARVDIPMPDTAYQLMMESLQNPKQMGFGRLANYVNLLEVNEFEQDERYYRIRLFQKIIFPITTVLFIVVGAFLGMEGTRSRYHLAIIFGALLVFIHSIFTPAFTHIGQIGLVPPWLAATLPLVITLAVARGLFALRHRLEGG